MIFLANIFFSIITIALFYVSLRNNKFLLTPDKVLLLFFVLDVLLPVYVNGYALLDYYNRDFCCLSRSDLDVSFVLYGIFNFLLILIILFGAKVPMQRGKLPTIPVWLPFVIFSIWLVSFFRELGAYGGFDSWYTSKIVLRWSGSEGHKLSTFHTAISAFSFRATWALFALKTKNAVSYRNTKVLLIILMSFTTFYRGTILIGLLLSLFILFGEKIFEFSYKRSTRLLVVVATVIVGITLLRSSLRVKEVKDDRPASEAISLLFEGQSLKGATRIIKFYKVDELFLGKTYLDMLLLPVPRAIYKNKPEWYGIDDISRKMGLPSTSQSSVSIFGEAFANFSFLGFNNPVLGIIILFFQQNRFGWLHCFCSPNDNVDFLDVIYRFYE